MGYEVGAAGAFGIYLPMLADPEHILHIAEVAKLYGEFKAEIDGLVQAYWEDDDSLPAAYAGMDPDEIREVVAEKWEGQLFDALRAAGVVVPEEAALFYTGEEDERPGRTATPAGEWVLGFGLLTSPWDYPAMDETFRKLAYYHTWVWGG